MTRNASLTALVAVALLTGYLASPSTPAPSGTIDVEVMGERVLTGCTRIK